MRQTYLSLKFWLVVEAFREHFNEKDFNFCVKEFGLLSFNRPPPLAAPKLNIFCNKSHNDNAFIGTPMKNNATSVQLLIFPI